MNISQESPDEDLNLSAQRIHHIACLGAIFVALMVLIVLLESFDFLPAPSPDILGAGGSLQDDGDTPGRDWMEKGEWDFATL